MKRTYPFTPPPSAAAERHLILASTTASHLVAASFCDRPYSKMQRGMGIRHWPRFPGRLVNHPLEPIHVFGGPSAIQQGGLVHHIPSPAFARSAFARRSPVFAAHLGQTPLEHALEKLQRDGRWLWELDEGLMAEEQIYEQLLQGRHDISRDRLSLARAFDAGFLQLQDTDTHLHSLGSSVHLRGTVDAIDAYLCEIDATFRFGMKMNLMGRHSLSDDLVLRQFAHAFGEELRKTDNLLTYEERKLRSGITHKLRNEDTEAHIMFDLKKSQDLLKLMILHTIPRMVDKDAASSILQHVVDVYEPRLQQERVDVAAGHVQGRRHYLQGNAGVHGGLPHHRWNLHFPWH